MKSVVVWSLAVAAATLISSAAVAESPLERAPGNVPAPDAKYISRSPSADGQLGMALLAAHVKADATLQSGAGATGGVHIATGTYEVDFNRDVSNCYYSANSYFTALLIGVEPRSGNPDGVYLIEEDSSGTPIDIPFYLTVFCAK